MIALTNTAELTTEPTFANLGIRDEIVRALAEKGIERPFAIQELTLPLALAGDDVIGQARTGMGKTFAFGVPLLQRITTGTESRPLTGAPRALVVVPTRELCLQVTDDLATAARYLTARIDVAKIFNGEEPDIYLKPDDQVLVGTNAIAPFLAALRGAFRITYGFGFLYDRNFEVPNSQNQ